MVISDDTPEPGALPEIYPCRPPVNLVVGPELLRPRNLFAFEGIDGAGKSELLRRVVATFEARGIATLGLKLGRSDVTAHALERAKWINANPLTINLLSWVTIYEQVAEAREALNGAGLIFFDRYVLTLMVRGILEGLPTGYMHMLEAYAPRPASLFLVDCDPQVACQRILGRGREISYFEAGSRIVDGLHQPMVENSPDMRGRRDRSGPLLEHLIRMRQGLLDLAKDYDNVLIIDNSGDLEEAVEFVVAQIDKKMSFRE